MTGGRGGRLSSRTARALAHRNRGGTVPPALALDRQTVEPRVPVRLQLHCCVSVPNRKPERANFGSPPAPGSPAERKPEDEARLLHITRDFTNKASARGASMSAAQPGGCSLLVVRLVRGRCWSVDGWIGQRVGRRHVIVWAPVRVLVQGRSAGCAHVLMMGAAPAAVGCGEHAACTDDRQHERAAGADSGVAPVKATVARAATRRTVAGALTGP
jgi:hypothetical protein